MALVRWTCWAAFAVIACVAAGARASEASTIPNAYAVVVGSNPGGRGQQQLAYAEDDARRVRALLVELARYEPNKIDLLLRPTTAQVLDSLERVRERLEQHRARGEDATLFFYYSGHARSSAMNLGTQTLALDTLRSKLMGLPTALTIVVLDACQSGAFSRVKGAEPAADFSFNSVNSLNTRGLAVMASSSSAELSQESERLRSSYFTHYLLVGLRGGGDRNGDGRVSLDEAYKYAYGETLAATSKTAVGGQHVTLETDLTGRGEVPITYPARATSRVVIPAEFEGQLLLQTRGQRAVLAELTKAKGSKVALALPPGRYDGVVRRRGRAWECPITLGEKQQAHLDLTRCSPVADQPAQTKGADRAGGGRFGEEQWSIELAGGLSLNERDDDYVRQLDAFGYGPEQSFLGIGSGFRWALGGSVALSRRVSMVARVQYLENRAFQAGSLRSFELDAYALGVGARLAAPVGPTFHAYGQLEVGPGLAFTEFRDEQSAPPVNDDQTFAGLYGALSVGMQLTATRLVGTFLEANYAVAPIVSNLIGDTHDSGGLSLLFGLRATTRGTP